MAFDGLFYHKHTRVLNKMLAGARIDKIYQRGDFDLILSLKNRRSNLLLISVQPSQPRIIPLDEKPEMPLKPAMFCMLMRKHLQGGRLVEIVQEGLERILYFVVDTRNQIGERVTLRLVVELMGKHANMMLIDNNDKIIDAIKRINASQSPRIIAPGYGYQAVPSAKLSSTSLEYDQFKAALADESGRIQKLLYQKFEGFSPAASREVCRDAGLAPSLPGDQLAEAQRETLWQSFQKLLGTLTTANFYIYLNQGRVDELSAYPLSRQDVIVSTEHLPYLTRFYAERRDTNQLTQKSKYISKMLDSTIERLAKKINNLAGDIVRAQSLEDYKLYGELLTANLHLIARGMSAVTVTNYYTNQPIEIPLDVRKSASQNAQAYYKKYNKAKVTLQKAKQLRAESKREIRYLKQVKSMLENADDNQDLEEIRDELVASGYLKARRRKADKRSKKLPPHHYRSSEGVDIYVGRNNYQNDELTTKRAHSEHIWLHTKDLPGAHVIISAEFPEINHQTIEEAAQIAAYHSDGRHSSQVPVDLTEVKYVKKPRGAKPGMVIYTDNKTIYASPDAERIKAMRITAKE